MWDELIAEAEKRWVAEAEAERLRNEVLWAEENRFMAEKLGELTGLLGEGLMNDLEIVSSDCDIRYGDVRFELRPRAWRQGYGEPFLAVLSRLGWSLLTHGSRDSVALDEPVVPGVTPAAMWLAERHLGYEREITSHVAHLERVITVGKYGETDLSPAEILDTLLDLAPEDEARWRALHADALARLENSTPF